MCGRDGPPASSQLLTPGFESVCSSAHRVGSSVGAGRESVRGALTARSAPAQRRGCRAQAGQGSDSEGAAVDSGKAFLRAQIRERGGACWGTVGHLPTARAKPRSGQLWGSGKAEEGGGRGLWRLAGSEDRRSWRPQGEAGVHHESNRKDALGPLDWRAGMTKAVFVKDPRG